MRKLIPIIFLFATVALLWISCRKSQEFPHADLDDRMSADNCTIFDESAHAFGQVIPGLSERDEQFHDLGDKMFSVSFVAGNAPLYGGLGPLYNNISCNRCHFNEGRGRPQDGSEPLQSMFFKLSLPGQDAHGAPISVPGFGSQLQDKSIAGITSEGSVNTIWIYEDIKLSDGTTIEVRRPNYTFVNLYEPLPSNVLYSPRVARPMLGMGLIEAIDEYSILKHADEFDENKDGISGRPNYVYDYVQKRDHVLGRLGWKAGVPDIKNQVAKAFNEDIGITSSVFPNKNATGQIQMQGAYLKNPFDLADSIVNAITFYARTLGVPARRNVLNEEIKNGQKLFTQIGCVKCHVDVQTTAINVAFAPLSNQLIRPYSDFLLHDMGSDLQDSRPEFEATGSEWRTSPLWGIGLTQKVSGYAFFLHDGRARTLTEAILWHGGEASQIKNAFKSLPLEKRNQLIKFFRKFVGNYCSIFR